MFSFCLTPGQHPELPFTARLELPLSFLLPLTVTSPTPRRGYRVAWALKFVCYGSGRSSVSSLRPQKMVKALIIHWESAWLDSPLG